MSVRMIGGKLVSDDEEPFTETPPEEAERDAPRPGLTDDGYPICDGCGKPNYEWQPGNRGRKPRFHKDCRPVSPQRGVRQGTRNEAALRDALEQRYLSLARIASMIHPAYGKGINEKIEQAVNADLAYARVNPRFRKALEKGLDKTALGEVIAVHVSMVAPIVVGESAKRARAKAAATGKGKPEQPKSGPTPQPRQAPPQPPPPPPDNVHRIRPDDEGDPMMPGEYEATGPAGESRIPETVNAAAMPGMPGG